MTLRTRHLVIIFALVVASVPVASRGRQAAHKEVDLLQFNWIGDPRVPDGSQIVFVRVVVDEAKDRYETSLFVVPTNGSAAPRPFTSGPFDTSPRWSPDGRMLAFVRAVDKDGKPEKGQIYLIPANGGEARALTDVAKGAASPLWSPDGKTIAFTTTALPSDSSKEDPKKSDVRVITKAVYRANGPSYFEPGRHYHIWTVASAFDAAGGRPKPRQLTFGDFDEENAAWSPDGLALYFVSTRILEPYYERNDADLYAVPFAGGDIVRIASIDGEIETFAPSPDGKRVVFLATPNGTPLRSYNQADLFVTDAAPESTPRNLTADYDFDMGGLVSGDQRAPRGGRGGGMVWSRDGKSVLVTSTVHGRTNVQRIRVSDGRMEAFTDEDQEVLALSASADGSTVVALASTATNIGDLFVADARKKTAVFTQVTRVQASSRRWRFPPPRSFCTRASIGEESKAGF
jgi:dipeptidyl aminopeptidase/acylaminoacyl peptidase